MHLGNRIRILKLCTGSIIVFLPTYGLIPPMDVGRREAARLLCFATRFSRFSFAKQFFYFHLQLLGLSLLYSNVKISETRKITNNYLLLLLGSSSSSNSNIAYIYVSMCWHLTTPAWSLGKAEKKSEIHQGTSHPSDIYEQHESTPHSSADQVWDQEYHQDRGQVHQKQASQPMPRRPKSPAKAWLMNW